MARDIAIVREPATTLGECLLTHRTREAIDPALARRQHEAYCEALAACGRELVRLEPDDLCPDGVFVEDPVAVLDELCVIARPATESRRREIPSLEAALRPHRELAHIREPGTLEGGDVVLAERTLFVGQSTRTNQEGVRQLRAHVEPLGYRVRTVPVPGCLHLSTGSAYIGDGRVLVNPRWVDARAYAGLETIEVHESEPWSANAVVLGANAIIAAGAPRTADRLRGLGFTVHEVGLSELQKAEGSVTCMRVLLSVD